MDERRQRILKLSRQQKLQQEYNKIEKECRKNCEVFNFIKNVTFINQ